MRSVLVVPAEVAGKRSRTVSARPVGEAIGPLAKQGLDERFGLAVGLGAPGTGVAASDAELGAGRVAGLSCGISGFRYLRTNRSLCDNRNMSGVQNNGGSTGGVTGRGFMAGRSGNPGGRPQGLAKATRALVGEDGLALVQLWWSITQDETKRVRDRLEASKLLADRGWGKAATYEPQEGDPFDLALMEQAAERFRQNVIRLAERHRRDANPSSSA